MQLQGEIPILTGLVGERVQEAINADLMTSVCDWVRERQREGLDIAGFGLGSRTHHLDHHLFSVEVRTATISDRQVHPAEEVLTFNYSLADGAPIELSDVFLPYDFTLAAILAVVGRDSYAARAEGIRLDAFLIDDRGVELVFPPCRLDACAAGYVSVVVPYADLTGLVDPDGAAAPYL